MSKTSRPDPAPFPSLAENYLGEGVTPGQISGDGFSMKRGGEQIVIDGQVPEPFLSCLCQLGYPR